MPCRIQTLEPTLVRRVGIEAARHVADSGARGDACTATLRPAWAQATLPAPFPSTGRCPAVGCRCPSSRPGLVPPAGRWRSGRPAVSPSGLVTIGLGLEALVAAKFAVGCFPVIPDFSQTYVLSFAHHLMGDFMRTGCVNFLEISSLYKSSKGTAAACLPPECDGDIWVMRPCRNRLRPRPYICRAFWRGYGGAALRRGLWCCVPGPAPFGSRQERDGRGTGTTSKGLIMAYIGTFTA